MKRILVILVSTLIIINTFSEEVKETKPLDEDARELQEIKSEYEKLAEEVDSLSFNNFVAKNKIAVIYFYSPGCQRCMEFNPHYLAAAENLYNVSNDIKFGKIKIQNEPELAEKYNIKFIPSVLVFTDGQVEKYESERTRVKLERFLRRKLGKVTSIIHSSDEIEEIVDNYDSIIIHLGVATELFTKVLSDVKYDEVHIYECYKCLNLGQEGDVVIIKNFEEKKNVLKNGYDEYMLSEFINQEYYPDVHEFDGIVFFNIFDKKTPALFYYRQKSKKSEETNNKEYEVLRSLSFKVKHFIKIVQVDTESPLGPLALDYSGINDVPSIYIHDTKLIDHTKYRYNGDINEESLLNFIVDWRENKLKPELKSESTELSVQKNKEEKYKFVKYLIGSEYEKVINQPKDIFVMMIDSDCKRCEDIFKTLSFVASKLANYQDLEFYILDQSKNQIVKGFSKVFPAFWFFGAENKDGLLYNLDYKPEEFMNFLILNASTPILHDDL